LPARGVGFDSVDLGDTLGYFMAKHMRGDFLEFLLSDPGLGKFDSTKSRFKS
jgi:hypothetical protein